jgi:hypothetical protein
MKKLIPILLFLLLTNALVAQKQVYIPRFITNVNMDLNNPASQWSYSRSTQTDNIVVFWEAGFGSDPSKAASPYTVNMNELLKVAEKSYAYYIDSLGFAVKGSSVTDRYKLMIFLLYSTEWAAYGSGQDDLVGTLHVNPAAAGIDNVLAHEIGHCFEYITGCDTRGGYRYGFGVNGSGGNGFWEQCAQWMAFKVYPQKQFTEYDFDNYIKKNHLHIIHEEPRYSNYFIQDYWTYKRGKNFMGRLWRESRSPEDPIETYKRLNSITQAQFNDEIYEHAARLTTWDIPAIKSYGANYINRRAQVKMNLTTDNFWQVDTSVTVQNYGYNSIKLNAPSSETVVSVNFKGMTGAAGYRNLSVDKGGWRFGFVALLENGTRVYSNTGTAEVQNGSNPETTLSFTCPDKCVKLWLVVSGAPQQHWRHPWDDNASNDEQWPYKVKFENTNLLGVYNNPIKYITLTYDVTMKPASDYTPVQVSLNTSRISEAFAMSPEDIVKNMGSKISYFAINPNGTTNTTSTANAPGHWFNQSGQTVSWGASAYVFSELNIGALIANIGQYPNRCLSGEQYTIKQALKYTKSATETAQVTLIFNIKIQEDILTGNLEERANNFKLYPNPTTGSVFWDTTQDWQLMDATGQVLENGNGTSLDLSPYSKGLYILKAGNSRIRIIRE